MRSPIGAADSSFMVAHTRGAQAVLTFLAGWKSLCATCKPQLRNHLIATFR